MGYQSYRGHHTFNMFSSLLLVTASAGVISAARVTRDNGFAPDFSYGAPEPSYGAPEPAEPAYAEPAQEYTSPSYTAEGSTELDFGSLLLPPCHCCIVPLVPKLHQPDS